MGNTNFMPRQVTDSNDSLDEGSNLFIRKLFLNTQAITYDIKCHDKSSNIDGYIELIDNEKRPVGKLTIQAKTYKSKYRGKKTAEIPSYFVAYAERMINEVCIFLSVDAVDEKIYWKYFTEEFIREFKKKGDCASHNYVFRQEEIISSGNVNSTINEWKHIFIEKVARFSQVTKDAQEIITENRVAFYSYPYECYQCIKILIDSKNVGIQYNEEEYFEILLKCYRTFMDNEDIEKADEVMDVFDILMLNSFTLKMGEILNEIDNN